MYLHFPRHLSLAPTLGLPASGGVRRPFIKIVWFTTVVLADALLDGLLCVLPVQARGGARGAFHSPLQPAPHGGDAGAKMSEHSLKLTWSSG